MRCAAAVIACSLFVLVTRVGAQQSPSAVFRATQGLGLRELERAVSAGAPALTASRRQVAVAQADARQARLFANPAFDAAWSTIPVGDKINYPSPHPLGHVPNYAVGLSYTFPVAKRGPRIGRADAVARGAHAELEYDVRVHALALAEVLGSLATSMLRRDGISELVEGGHRAAELAEARLRSLFGTPLDVDQIRIEVQRTEQLLSSVESDIRAGLAACASYVGTPCETFPDAESARAFLDRWLAPNEAALRAKDLQQRADLRALGAYTDAARADVHLAEAEKIPDPTVRLGYLRDQFTYSGNQLNSLNVGVSVPLPVFDHGQAHRQSAEASRTHLLEERERRLDVARARIPELARRLELSRGRCTQLTREVIPQARTVLSSLEKAVENRLLPLTQVIQSRRIVSELFIEEAESCGDAYLAALELIRETSSEGEQP